MANTTIEDVLQKSLTKYHPPVSLDNTCLWKLYSEVVRDAMQEWASLTPSNDKYWRERCEAAEAVINNEDQDGFKLNDYEQWIKLKSTPIPILTPCVEKEVREHLDEELSLLVSIENDLPKEGLGRIFVKNRIDFLKRKLDATTH